MLDFSWGLKKKKKRYNSSLGMRRGARLSWSEHCLGERCTWEKCCVDFDRAQWPLFHSHIRLYKKESQVGK